jgi:hypothetical protein
MDSMPWIISLLALAVAGAALVVSMRAERRTRRTSARLREVAAEVTAAGHERSRRPAGPQSPPPEFGRVKIPTQQEMIDRIGEGLQDLDSRMQELERDGRRRRIELLDQERRSAVEEPAARPEAPRGHSPGPGAQPVEIRDGLIIPSRSLSAMGSLLPGDGSAPALLYLNETVEIDHLSHNRWAQYFDFGGGEPYRRYRTLEPSKIDWNPATEQGRLIKHGRVEAV